MTLTKRQWIMFSLFIIEFAFVLFNAALFGTLLVISSSLSTLLFLGALYLEHNHNSKRILLLAGVWLIVNMVFSMFTIIPALISNFNVYNVIDFIVMMMLYVSIYLFSMKYYNGHFYNKRENIRIILLVLPTILISLYLLFNFLSSPIQLDAVNLIYVIVGYISRMIIPIAIATYTYLRGKNIQ